MVDYVKLHLKAGRGGNGIAAFFKKRGKNFGPPHGGDGGDGGSVYFAVDKSLTTLLPYRYKKDFSADDGKNGETNNRQGAEGEDLVLQVPPGTKISDQEGRLFADLTSVGEKVMVAKGGAGGRGNAHVKKSDFRDREQGDWEMWSFAEKGAPGQEVTLILELKLLADVGLIGLPSSGKSTLLSKLTSATPKIAAYPFTTLEPVLGMFYHKGREMVIADIPGLIEGASEGKGLGDQFLRHVERTKVLVHLVPADSVDPLGDYETIRTELEKYSQELLIKTEVVLLTKIDTLEDSEVKKKVALFKKKKISLLPISSMSGQGLEKLKDKLIEIV